MTVEPASPTHALLDRQLSPRARVFLRLSALAAVALFAVFLAAAFGFDPVARGPIRETIYVSST